jgi:hypothetical protein
MDKPLAEVCREHAQYYRKVAELVSDSKAAEMYRLLAQAFDLEAEEAEREDPVS